MQSPRETIYAALYAKVAAVAGFVTTSRRLLHWTDTPVGAQPALFMAQISETAETTTPGLNTVYLLNVHLYIYANTRGDQTISPASILNPLIDAALLAATFDRISNKQTLGGLVEYVIPDGTIQTDEGVLGDQGVVIIPLVMKAT
jgi:hypothetical protein